VRRNIRGGTPGQRPTPTCRANPWRTRRFRQPCPPQEFGQSRLIPCLGGGSFRFGIPQSQNRNRAQDPKAVSPRMRRARAWVHLLLVNRPRRLHFGANRLGPASAGLFRSAIAFCERWCGTETVMRLIGTCKKIAAVLRHHPTGDRNMRKIVMLVTLGLVLAASTATVLTVSAQPVSDGPGGCASRCR
jgi:hypothetical protein